MIVVWIVAAVLALVLLVTVIPVNVSVTSPDPEGPVEVRLIWLFGVVRVPLSRGTDAPPKGKTTSRRRGKKRDNRWSIPEDPRATIKAAVRLLLSIRRRITYTGSGQIWLGLSDPADTGILWGFIGPSAVWIQRVSGLAVYPCFSGPRVAFAGRAEIGLIPATLLLPMIRFFSVLGRRRIVRFLRRDR